MNVIVRTLKMDVFYISELFFVVAHHPIVKKKKGRKKKKRLSNYIINKINENNVFTFITSKYDTIAFLSSLFNLRARSSQIQQ